MTLAVPNDPLAESCRPLALAPPATPPKAPCYDALFPAESAPSKGPVAISPLSRTGSCKENLLARAIAVLVYSELQTRSDILSCVDEPQDRGIGIALGMLDGGSSAVELASQLFRVAALPPPDSDFPIG